MSSQISKGKGRPPVKPLNCDLRFQFLGDDEIDQLKEGYKPANTERCTRWALKNFEDWREARERAQREKCPDDLLKSSDPILLCEWLSRYAAETRTVDGNAYPPSTLYQLLTGLLRHMRDMNPEAPNIFDKRPAFQIAPQDFG